MKHLPIVDAALVKAEEHVRAALGLQDLHEVLEHQFHVTTLVDLIAVLPMDELRSRRVVRRFYMFGEYIRAHSSGKPPMLAQSLVNMADRIAMASDEIQGRIESTLGGNEPYLVYCYAIHRKLHELLLVCDSGIDAQHIDIASGPLQTLVALSTTSEGPNEIMYQQLEWVRERRQELLLSSVGAHPVIDMILHELEDALCEHLGATSG